MKNISIHSVKGFEFTGTWYDPCLTPDQMIKLGLKELPGEIAIEGSYSLFGKHSFVEVDKLYIVEGCAEIEALDAQVELDGVADLIQGKL